MSLLLLLSSGRAIIPVAITHMHATSASGVALPSLRGASAGVSKSMSSASVSKVAGSSASVTERRASAEVSK